MKFFTNSFVLTLLMLGTQPALADEERAAIYKCTKPNGAIFYKDKSCPTDETEKKLKRLKDPDQAKTTALGDSIPIIEKSMNRALTPDKIHEEETSKEEMSETELLFEPKGKDTTYGSSSLSLDGLEKINSEMAASLESIAKNGAITGSSSSSSSDEAGAGTEKFLSQTAKQLSRLEFKIPLF